MYLPAPKWPTTLAMSLAMLLIVAMSARPAAAGRVASILSPSADQSVQAEHEIRGRLYVAGTPVVLVRPDADPAVWWIQPPAEVERGAFRAQARFGRGELVPGTRFFIVVVVLRSPIELELFRGREVIRELPRGLLRSAELPVTLAAAPRPVAAVQPSSSAATSANSGKAVNPNAAVVVLKPAKQGKVQRAEEVVGRVRLGVKPFVLVRPDIQQEAWWVQDEPLQSPDGYFKATVRFGNSSTKPGQKFWLVVAAPASPQEAAQFKPGHSLSELPRGPYYSEPVLVELSETIAAVR